MNTLKEKIKNKEKICGTHINLNDPCISKIVAKLNFDYIWIDMEHSYLSYANLMAHINTIQGYGVPVIVRIPQHDFTAAKKIIEMGPDGVIFPMIKNKEEADKMISYTLYPPYGNRGYGPLNAVSFGVDDVDEYIHTNHKNMCRFIQIEHADLVGDLERVVTNPYIDGYIFGPNDLSGSINELTNVFGEKTQQLIKKSIEILNKHDKYIGLSTGDTNPEIIKRWHDLGIHMISAASDLGNLTTASRSILNTLHEFHTNAE